MTRKCTNPSIPCMSLPCIVQSMACVRFLTERKRIFPCSANFDEPISGRDIIGPLQLWFLFDFKEITPHIPPGLSFRDICYICTVVYWGVVFTINIKRFLPASIVGAIYHPWGCTTLRPNNCRRLVGGNVLCSPGSIVLVLRAILFFFLWFYYCGADFRH